MESVAGDAEVGFAGGGSLGDVLLEALVVSVEGGADGLLDVEPGFGGVAIVG